MALSDVFSGFLGGGLGNSMENDPDDVRLARRHLRGAGFLGGDDESANNPILTRDLDESIRDFQRNNNLRVDGFMRPGGETERGLYQILTGGRADDVFGPAEGGDGGQVGYGGNVSGGLERITRGLTGADEALRKTSPEVLYLREAQAAQNGGDIGSSNNETEQKLNNREQVIDTFLTDLIVQEGGYTEGNNDKRGRTNIGINKDTLDEFKKWKLSRNENLPDDFTTDVQKVTPALAKKIYKEMYFERYGINKIENQIIAGNVFDAAVNQGPHNAVVWLQKALNSSLNKNIKVDGIVGKETLDAISVAQNNGLVFKVNNNIVEKRKERYQSIAAGDATQKIYLKGWMARADRFKTMPISKKKPVFR